MGDGGGGDGEVVAPIVNYPPFKRKEKTNTQTKQTKTKRGGHEGPR